MPMKSGREMPDTRRFENPPRGEMILTRPNWGDPDHDFEFLSVVTSQIVRLVGATKIFDENGKEVYVVKCSLSESYDENPLRGGYIGVAYSPESAEKMASDYLKEASETVRRKYYSNYTLVDKLNFDS